MIRDQSQHRNPDYFTRPRRTGRDGYSKPTPTDRHPSDITWGDIAVWAVIAIAFGCALAGITIWADIPFQVAL